MKPSCMVCCQYYGFLDLLHTVSFHSHWVCDDKTCEICWLQNWNILCSVQVKSVTFSVGRLPFLGLHTCKCFMADEVDLQPWFLEVECAITADAIAIALQVNLQGSANLDLGPTVLDHRSGHFLSSSAVVKWLVCMIAWALQFWITDLGTSFPLGPLLLSSNGLSLLWWNFCDDELL